MKLHSSWVPFLLVTVLILAFTLGCSDLLDMMQDDDEAEPPEAPSNLTVNLSGELLILSWWDNSSEEDGFGIEVQIDNSSWARTDVVGADVTNYSFGVDVGVSYAFRVYAFLDDMESSYSNTAYFSLDPDTPQNLRIADSGTDWVELQWDDPSSMETGYMMERSDDDGNDWTTLGPTDTDVTTYTDEGLSTGVTYYYRVKALYSETESDYSNTVTFTVSLSAPPNFQIVESGENWIEFSWEDPSNNEAGFRIDRSDDLGTTWYEHIYLDANITSCTDTNVEPGKDYTYRIVTLGGGSESEPSGSILTATVLFGPTNLSAEIVDVSGYPGVQLTWFDQSSAEHGYTVERKTDAIGWEVVRTAGADLTEWVDESPYFDATNYYRVKATTDIISSPYSDEVNVYVTAPSNFSVLASTGFEGMSVGYVPGSDGGITWSVIDRDDQGVGVFVADAYVYEGSRSAQIVDYTSYYADVMMRHAEFSGRVRTQMMVYCQDTDKVGNFIGKDATGNELFRISFWWANGTYQYWNGSSWIDTGVNFPTETWYEMAIEVDTSTDQWWFYSNGQTIIDGMSYLVSGDGTYVGTLIRCNPASYMNSPLYIDNVEVGIVQ